MVLRVDIESSSIREGEAWYHIVTGVDGQTTTVEAWRRYCEFAKLNDKISKTYKCPKCPPKRKVNFFLSKETFLSRRQDDLNMYLKTVVGQVGNVAGADRTLLRFLGVKVDPSAATSARTPHPLPPPPNGPSDGSAPLSSDGSAPLSSGGSAPLVIPPPPRATPPPLLPDEVHCTYCDRKPFPGFRTCCRACALSGGQEHRIGCCGTEVRPQLRDACCITGNCSRKPYPGDRACCRTCARTNGAQHGAACNNLDAIKDTSHDHFFPRAPKVDLMCEWMFSDAGDECLACFAYWWPLCWSGKIYVKKCIGQLRLAQEANVERPVTLRIRGEEHPFAELEEAIKFLIDEAKSCINETKTAQQKTRPRKETDPTRG